MTTRSPDTFFFEPKPSVLAGRVEREMTPAEVEAYLAGRDAELAREIAQKEQEERDVEDRFRRERWDDEMRTRRIDEVESDLERAGASSGSMPGLSPSQQKPFSAAVLFGGAKIGSVVGWAAKKTEHKADSWLAGIENWGKDQIKKNGGWIGWIPFVGSFLLGDVEKSLEEREKAEKDKADKDAKKNKSDKEKEKKALEKKEKDQKSAMEKAQKQANAEAEKENKRREADAKRREQNIIKFFTPKEATQYRYLDDAGREDILTAVEADLEARKEKKRVRDLAQVRERDLMSLLTPRERRALKEAGDDEDKRREIFEAVEADAERRRAEQLEQELERVEQQEALPAKREAQKREQEIKSHMTPSEAVAYKHAETDDEREAILEAIEADLDQRKADRKARETQQASERSPEALQRLAREKRLVSIMEPDEQFRFEHGTEDEKKAILDQVEAERDDRETKRKDREYTQALLAFMTDQEKEEFKQADEDGKKAWLERVKRELSQRNAIARQNRGKKKPITRGATGAPRAGGGGRRPPRAGAGNP